MIPTYASHRTQPPSEGFKVIAIPGSAVTIERIFYIQFRNRAGRSLLSEGQALTSSGVRVSLNSNLIFDTEEVFWVSIAFSLSGNDSTDAKIIASWQARDSNQTTRRSLPVSIDFTTPEHFKTNRVVASLNDLPAFNIKNGAIALVAETGNYYRYDTEAYFEGNNWYSYGALATGHNNWIQEQPGKTFDAYQSSTTELGGSDLRIDTVENSLKIPPKIGQSKSAPQRYWFNNGFEPDGGSPIVNGRYTLDISVNGLSGYSSVFANKFEYYLRGYLDRETFELNTDPEGVNELKVWNPTDSYIKLPEDLPRNHAAVYDFVLAGSNDDYLGILPTATPEIQVNFIEVEGFTSRFSELASSIGDLVFSDRNRLLIVPGLKRLDGIASIAIVNSSLGYLIDTTTTQYINDLPTNTNDLYVVISGSLNGYTTVRNVGETLEPGEEIRAYLSTRTGYSQPIASGLFAASNTGIVITVEHPLTANELGIIRSDYPDLLLAGNELADFTPTAGYIFLEISGIVYQSDQLQVGSLSTQTFAFQDLTEFTQIGSIPSRSSDDFSLFDPVLVTGLSSGTGTFNSNIQAYFAYYYDEDNIVATIIRHDTELSIPTATKSLGEVFAELSQLVEHLSDRENPHEVTTTQIGAATQVDFEAHEGDFSNPHQVTRSQLGAASQSDLNLALTLINANTTAINDLPIVDVKSVANIQERDAIANPSQGDIAKVADNGSGDRQDFYWDGTVWSEFAVLTGQSNNVYSVTTIAERNALTDLVENDLAKVANSDGNGTPKDYAWDGTQWLPYVGAASGGANNVYLVENISDRDALTGVIENDIAKVSDDGFGNSRDYVYDGTGWVAFASAVQTPEEIKASLESLVAPNQLKGSAIAGLADVLNDPIDGYALIYSSSENALVWQYVNRYSSVGAGAILLPLSQSTFTANDGTTITAYTPDSGDMTWTDIRVISTANAPDNQIQSGQLVIATDDTGAVLDLATSNTVIKVDYLFNSGDCDGLVLRYSSDGNMLLLVLTENAIALKEVVDDVATTLEARAYNFSDTEKYLIEVQAVGVTYKVLIRNTVSIFQGVSSKFKNATSFGLAKLDPVGVGAIAPEEITEESNNINYGEPINGGTDGDSGQYNFADIQGILTHLDATDSSTLTLNGTEVTNWIDKSGNNNNAILGIGSPQLGTGAIVFDGNDGLSLDQPRFIGNAPRYIILSIKLDYTANSKGKWIYRFGEQIADRHFGLALEPTGELNLNAWSSNDTRGTINALPNNQYAIVETVYDGTTARVLINGLEDITKVFTYDTSDNDTSAIGYLPGFETDGLTGEIKEFLVADRVLTQAERDRIYQSMLAKLPQAN